MNKRNIINGMAMAIGVAMLGSGCISVNVGKPETFSKEFYGGEQPVKVLSEKCLKTEPAIDSRQLAKGRLGIGLRGEIETKTEIEKIYKTVNVERQKKIDFGLCPGLREVLDGGAKEGSDNMRAMVGFNFDLDSKTYVNLMSHGFGNTMGMFLGFFLMTPYATIVEPIAGDYSCSTHHWVLPETPSVGISAVQFFAQEVGDRQKALEIISSPEFESLGVKTYVNSGESSQSAFASNFTHMPLFGFHKRSRVRVLPIEVTRHEVLGKTETKVENKMAVGPFRVRLSIPSRGYEETVEVPKGRSQAWFNNVPDGVAAGTDIEIAFEVSDEEPVNVTATLLGAIGPGACALAL